MGPLLRPGVNTFNAHDYFPLCTAGVYSTHHNTQTTHMRSIGLWLINLSKNCLWAAY